MNRQSVVATVIGCALMWIGCSSDAVKTKLETDKDKTSYALGLDVGANFRRMKAEVDLSSLAQGIRDTLNGNELLVPADQVRSLIRAFQKRAYERRNTKDSAAASEPVSPGAVDLTPKSTLATEDEKMSYAMGIDIGASFKRVDADIDIPSLVQAIIDTIRGEKPLLSADDARHWLKEFSDQARVRFEEKRKAAALENMQLGKAFLAQNSGKEGVTSTSSGLQFEIVKAGKGKRPRQSDSVVVHYVGTLIDGTEFDSSRKRGNPTGFRLGGVIAGWREGLQLMPLGSTYRFTIPSELAYADRPPTPKISPNAVLLFEVELLEIHK